MSENNIDKCQFWIEAHTAWLNQTYFVQSISGMSN